MRIWGADGALQLDENSFTIRVALSTLVTFSVGGSKANQDFSVPGVGPGNGSAIVVPVGAYSDSQMQFETELIDNVTRVYNHTRGFAASTVASGTMRLIVMRWN
ncbi:hypothetical protein C1Y08_20485 [Pseudomonas sp. FW306-02-F02-AA]|uniref:Uncharacterized protein n=1 Tax=Pseudomonas fluorescens TaxID=294 RepID=A0A0N9W012_PSEFL|nr:MULTISPECIES: hypothetical protein [Pseudomonas]ALI04370.1 hypothetical protein AO353_26125 [Pseudomonas fluorescens]PMZ03848.1 hypothetical protein C1Y07_11580 [Pseudomonas sp. FW306-02-F02-AB]PMZ08213.1 hypothetical protein C1Y06_19920 [Pseudomonas sp. FW306-02-H06C]PMZ13953.1 hypothetical protein C1Y08_20485 [Pseudomonas sp. FW306-02-F02-AA]PMZ21538.1 hypothetical protein C1Y09_13970 [Pseudomonas sp. FW306-02-F08-AA]